MVPGAVRRPVPGGRKGPGSLFSVGGRIKYRKHPRTDKNELKPLAPWSQQSADLDDPDPKNLQECELLQRGRRLQIFAHTGQPKWKTPRT